MGEPLTLTGTGTPGTTVTVYDGDAGGGRDDGGPGRHVEMTLPPLAAGVHKLVAKLLGADGVAWAASAPVELTVADGQVVVATPAASTGAAAATVEPTTAAVVGAATAVATAAAGVPGARNAGGAAEAGAPLTLEGTGTPGTTVKVYEGDKPLGEATVGADGKWKMTLPMLAAGAHSLLAKIFGADGKEQATSEVLNVTVPEPPAASLPVIYPPAAEKLRAGATTELAGTAAPGTLLKLYDGGKLLGEATADANGDWKMAVPPLDAGEHTLTAITYGPDGGVLASSKPLTVIVPEAQPAAETGAAAQPRIGWPPDGSTVVSSRPLVTGQSFPRRDRACLRRQDPARRDGCRR